MRSYNLMAAITPLSPIDVTENDRDTVTGVTQDTCASAPLYVTWLYGMSASLFKKLLLIFYTISYIFILLELILKRFYFLSDHYFKLFSLVTIFYSTRYI